MRTTAAHRWLLYGILVVVAGVSVASYWLPVTSSTANVAAHHWRIAATMLMTLSFCGGAALFLNSINKFKAGLQVAYRWFAVGMILFGFSLFQLVLIVVLGVEDSFWASSGMVVIPFILATLCMYIGMRKLALLLSVHTILTSLVVSVGMVVVATVLSGLVASMFAPNNSPGIVTETYTATVAWSLGYGLLAWLLVRKTQRVIGADYQAAMHWLAIALGMLTFAGAHEYLGSYVLTEKDAYIDWGVSLWPFILAGFLFIKAGYIFGLERNAATAAAPQNTPDEVDRAYIDSILGIAALASRPQDIDAALDGLREVTASKGANQLSEAQHNQLAEVYRQLEAYLVISDRLRSFTKEQLRSQIAGPLKTRVEQLDAGAPTPNIPA